MTDGKRNIIQQFLQEYDIQSAEDIQDVLKDLLVGTIKEMMETLWMSISAMKSQNALTAKITGMAINPRISTVAKEA